MINSKSLHFDLSGLDVLRNLQISGMTKNIHIEEAITKLLEHNLSAKYALVGKLCKSAVMSILL